MAGIALGVAVLITVSTVMNGFEKEVRNGILSTVAHATITGSTGTLENWPEIARQIAVHPEVIAVAPFISGGAMVVEGRNVVGVMMRGILPAAEDQVAEFTRHLVSGHLTALIADTPGIILGQDLATRLGISLGAQITLITARAGATEMLPHLTRHTVVGLFHFGIRQYDTSLVLLHLNNAARILGISDRVSGLRLKVADLYHARRIVQEAAGNLPYPLFISDWSRQNANFFIALSQQRRMMLLILGLIVAVAAFNLVSALVMMVTDKAAAIAILRTLGMTPGEIVAVFIVQGSLIGALGTVVGISAGVTLSLNIEQLAATIERRLGFNFLAIDVYPIAQIPADLQNADVLTIGLAAFSLSVMATLYPAWHAAQLRPATALRYE